MNLLVRAPLAALAALALATTTARAEPEPVKAAVALLPLDADARLELYGQPVASEIARALGAGGVEVIVVGPKLAVPERAKLIVDGRIAGPSKGEKSDVVTLTVRVRRASDGVVLDTVEATAPGLANIDKAAAELSARVLPVVRGTLDRLTKPPPVAIAPAPVVAPPPAPVVAPRVKPWKVVARGEARLAGAFALGTEVDPERVIELEVKRFAIERGAVPLARARVHARVTLQGRRVFDRTIVTDTVVGDRGMTDDALAQRTAREVRAILAPHVRRYR